MQQVLGEDASIPVYHALVMGVNDYEHWQDLRQARQDAEEVAKTLEDDYGFKHVHALYDEDVSLSKMQSALRRLARGLTRNDSLLIYFAGHGYYDKLLRKGYWVPSEGRERIDDEPAIIDWFHNTMLKQYLDVMPARHVLVVSDSCFSGALMRGGRVDLTKKENLWYRRAISQPARWCVASGDLETVPDQSVFARKFVQALQYPRQDVFSASDLAGWIKREVASHTGTQPVFGPITSASGSDVGEFVFLLERNPAPTPEPAEPPPVVRPVTGTLVIESPVEGVVSLNGGKDYPISSNRALKWSSLQVGTYTVLVRSGSRNWQDSVEVRENRTTTIRASGLEPPAPRPPVQPRVPRVEEPPQPAYFEFYTRPANATIYIDGRRVSSKKVAVVPGTRHAVSVQADGYKSHSGSYSVEAGDTRRISARLDKEREKKKKTSYTPMW